MAASVPAGLLREIRRVDGPGAFRRASCDHWTTTGATTSHRRFAAHVPILRARIWCRTGTGHVLRGRRVVAFAGIGDPEKFFHTLQALGAHVVARHPFDDHEGFGESDIQPILDEAYSLDAIPVTTAKDAVRLPPDQRQQVNVLSVAVEWADVNALDALLDRTTARTVAA